MSRSAASLATSLLNSAAALHAACAILGPDRRWVGQNPGQRAWIDDTYAPGVRGLAKVPEIQAQATRAIEEHVAFLREHGWEPQITEVPADGFLTAAVLDVTVLWPQIGTRERTHVDGVGEFDSTKLKAGVRSLFHRPSSTPVFVIVTQSGDEVWIAETDEAPANVPALAALARGVFQGADRTTNFRADGVIVPMLDLGSKQELALLAGLRTVGQTGGEYVLAQAMQQATLKLNEKGARARAADEMAVMRSASPKPQPYRITKPFLVEIRRPNVEVPLFTAYAGYDGWKDPGSL